MSARTVAVRARSSVNEGTVLISVYLSEIRTRTSSKILDHDGGSSGFVFTIGAGNGLCCAGEGVGCVLASTVQSLYRESGFPLNTPFSHTRTYEYRRQVSPAGTLERV